MTLSYQDSENLVMVTGTHVDGREGYVYIVNDNKITTLYEFKDIDFDALETTTKELSWKLKLKKMKSKFFSSLAKGFEWIIFETESFSMNLTFDFSHFGLGFRFKKGDLSNYFNIDFLFFDLFIWHHPEWDVTDGDS